MDTATFLARHFADLRDDELIEIRCIYKDDSRPVLRKYFTGPAGAAAWALERNAEGYHAFYGANPRSKQAVKDGLRGKETVARVTHLWVDIDGIDRLDGSRLFASLSQQPEVAIWTGGGFHALWRIHPTAHGHDTVEHALGCIARNLQGDPAVAEIARVLRLPQTINWKPEYPEGTHAFVDGATDFVHSLADFIVEDERRPPPPASPPIPPADIDQAEFLDALNSIDPWSVSYEEWLRLLMAIHAYEPCFLDHAVAWAKGKPGEVEAKWRSFRREGSNPATVFHFARQAGWRPARNRALAPVDFGDDAAPPVARRQPPRIAVTRLDAFLDEVDVPPTWVVDDFLHASGVSLLVAKQKVGKSTWAANLAHAVGTGSPFMGRPTRRGLVHVYSLEVSRDWVRQQYRGLIAAHGVGIPDLAIHASTGLVEGAWDQIAAAVMRDRPALVVIDTLAKAVPIADGNNYHEVYKAMMPVMELAEASGAHVMCVHHTNKGGAEGADAVMGSVAFAASVDLTIMLRRDRDAGLRTMEMEARFLPEQPPLAFDFDDDRRLVVLGDHQRVLRESAEARILAYIAVEPGCSAADIQQATGLPREVCGPALFRLTQVMRVRAEGSPKRHTVVEYHQPGGVTVAPNDYTVHQREF